MIARNLTTRLIGVVTTALLLGCGAVDALASPGDVDPGFGLGGVAISSAQVTGWETGGFAFGPDGGSYVGGTKNGSSGADDLEIIAKFNSAGQLDPSFFDSGQLSHDTTSTSSTLGALAVRPDGVPLSGGSVVFSATRFVYVHRLNDTHLTNYTESGTDCSVAGMTTQSDNKAVTAGQCGEYPYLTRFLSTGGIDVSFNGSGAAPASTTKGAFSAVAAQSDGKLIAVGEHDYASGPTDAFVVRYTSTGGLDPSFHDATSGSGRVSISVLDWNDYAYAVALQPDGKIVVAGVADTAGSSLRHGFVARLNTDGSLDSSFGTGGIFVRSVADHDVYFKSLAIQPNGKIVVGGYSDGQALVGRLNSNGSPDGNFADGGFIARIPQTSGSRVIGIAIQPDGKIVVGAIAQIAGVYIPVVMRLQGGEIATPATPKPKTKFKSPSKSRLSARKFKSVSGTASNATRVEVAILKTDKTLLKKKRRCLQLSSSNRARFAKVRSVKRKCVPSKWLKASGASSWKLKIKKRLPTGKYTIYVRATGSGGTSTPAKKSLTLTR